MNSPTDARLSALLDGQLTPEEESTLRAEIAGSPELQGRLAELAAVDESLRALAGPRVPEDAHARLRARISAERRASVRRAPRIRRRLLAGVAAAAAAAGLALWLRSASPTQPGSAPPVAQQDPLVPEPEPALAQEAKPPEQATALAAQEPEAPAGGGVSQDVRLPEDLLVPAPEDTAALLEELAEAGDDLEVIAVLDWLAVLDELEADTGSG